MVQSMAASLIQQASGAKYLVLVAAIVVAATVILVSAVNGGSAFSPTVNITCSDNTILVDVTLPGPTYYYYAYTYDYVSVVPVTVIVAVEDYSDPGAPKLVGVGREVLEAYGTMNSASFNFTIDRPGTYRVKVLFWNKLLAELYTANESWFPLADPVLETCTLPT